MLTTREAADRLGIKPRSVAALIQRGLLAATWNAYARRFEIEPTEVERYERERRLAHRPRKETPMLYRVKTTGQDFRYTYDQVTDNWEKTETENEYRVQVADVPGFEELAEDDPAIVSYQAL